MPKGELYCNNCGRMNWYQCLNCGKLFCKCQENKHVCNPEDRRRWKEIIASLSLKHKLHVDNI